MSTPTTATPTMSTVSPHSTPPPQVQSLYIIYDADGTLTGELLYMAKKALGIAHCAACDITHGPRREKPEFTALKTTTGWTVPLLNIHRDEMDETMNACVGSVLPCVVARTDTGDVILVRPNELHECAGSVDSFVYIVDQRASQINLKLNRVPNVCPLLPTSPSTPEHAQQHSPSSDTTSISLHDSQVPTTTHHQSTNHFHVYQKQHHLKPQLYSSQFQGSTGDAVVPSTTHLS